MKLRLVVEEGPILPPAISALIRSFGWSLAIALGPVIADVYDNLVHDGMPIDWARIRGVAIAAAGAGCIAFWVRHRVEVFALLQVPPEAQAKIEELEQLKSDTQAKIPIIVVQPPAPIPEEKKEQ